jgi:Zn-dependent metalloprotease
LKRKSAALLAIVFCVLSLPTSAAAAAGRRHAQEPKGKTLNSYRVGQGGGTPAWVESAFRRGLAHLTQHGKALGLVDPEAEVALAGADRDELGMTHVRLEQVFRGVPVFGGQLILHMEADSVRELVSGRIYAGVRDVNTTPRIDATRAIEAAKSTLGDTGQLAQSPAARLVLLPHQIKNPRSSDSGATLVYLVELLIMDGTPNTAHHYYFVNAGDGSIAWHYNNLPNQIYKGAPVPR